MTQLDDSYVETVIRRDGMTKELATSLLSMLNELRVYYFTGNRYVNKNKIVEEWMANDKKRDEHYESAKAPEGITCLTCGRAMAVSLSTLDFRDDSDEGRVLFFYDCPLKHPKRRAFYEDGEEYRSEIPKCPKCAVPLPETVERKSDTIFTHRKCAKCGYFDTQELVLHAKTEKKVDHEYEKDRDRFCMTAEEGETYIREEVQTNNIARLADSFEKSEQNHEEREKLSKIKKLKITELEQILSDTLEKSGYIKFQLKTPEISKDVTVSFVICDIKTERTDRDSSYTLETTIRKILKDTNWRLMTGGVNYRLGMLEGRLKGYEKEEDLLNLVWQQEKKNK